MTTPAFAGDLNVVRLGKTGPPLVLLHANPTDHRLWIFQMAHFSSMFRTIALDFPGYGRSPAALRNFTMQELAEACWRAIANEIDEPATLAGVSVGANVALHMANLKRESTRALILSGYGYFPVKEFAAKRIAQYTSAGSTFRRQHLGEILGPQFRDTPLARYIISMIERDPMDVDTVVSIFEALAPADPPSLYAGIAAPTLLITGSEDATHNASLALAGLIPDCELRIMRDAGHACNVERPWEWDDYALQFLTTHGILTHADAAN